MSSTPPILDIFKSLSFQQERDDCPMSGLPSEVAQVVDKIEENMQEVKPLNEAIKNSVEIHRDWSCKSTRLRLLHEIRKILKSTSEFFPKWKTQLSLFIDYFDFYYNVVLQIHDKQRVYDVVLIVLSCDSFLPAAATISAALTAGCLVLVDVHESKQSFFKFLQGVLSKAGLPNGVFNLVTDSEEADGFALEGNRKITFFGCYSSAQELYSKTVIRPFSFCKHVCPNNTAAFILESADFDAAVDKIIWETWGQEDPFFAVSTLVIQESVYQEVFRKLRYKMDKLMIENKYSLKFKDKHVAEKIQKLVTEALNAGATVEESRGCGEWHPTVIVNYQSQSVDDHLPVLKVLICRTAKEGVALLNNCRYSLGTSIWSEISSEALQISSNLFCPNIWINSHGQTDASVPLQGTGFSGNCVLGGRDGEITAGFLEFYSSVSLEVVKGSISEKYDILNNRQVLETAAAAQKAFLAWRLNKNKREYLPNGLPSIVCNFLKKDTYTDFTSMPCLYECNKSKYFSILKEKIPVGVILLLVTSNSAYPDIIATLIVSAISAGNSLIVAFNKESSPLHGLIKSFTENLPKNVLSTIGLESVIHIIAHPNIQAIWYHGEHISSIFCEALQKHSAKNIKHFWQVNERPPFSMSILEKECSQNKIVWLPKIDQFP